MCDLIRGLMKHEWLKYAKFAYIPENSMGHSIGHIYNILETEFPGKIVTYFQKHTADNRPHGDPGIVTSHKGKVDYANSLRHNVMRGTLLAWRDLHCTNTMVIGKSREALTAELWDKLWQQMHRYREVKITSLQPGGRDKVVISGVVDKTGKKNLSENDDLMFALTFCNGFCDLIMDRQLQNFNYKFVP